MQSAEAVVREFCEAVNRKDTDRLRGLLAPEIVYHNIGMEPSVGLEATLANLAGQWQRFSACYEYRLSNIAASGDVVLTERLDVISTGGPQLPVPVMGTFEVRDGKIVAWRDYFNPALVQKMASGEDVSALVPPERVPAA